jgi:ribosomal protein S18 acetylase RimI-like enzyme
VRVVLQYSHTFCIKTTNTAANHVITRSQTQTCGRSCCATPRMQLSVFMSMLEMRALDHSLCDIARRPSFKEDQGVGHAYPRKVVKAMQSRRYNHDIRCRARKPYLVGVHMVS